VLRPPLREPRFWIVQAVVVALAAAHLIIDITSKAEPSAVPAGLPVALLLAPVLYAALRYGLPASVATAIGATVLWLPDLLLPRDQGHVANDSVELGLVIAVAVFVGYHIDAERVERTHARQARSGQRAAEARYQQLFNTNAAPILVVGESGEILDANPAARALVTGDVEGEPVTGVLGLSTSDSAGRVIAISAPQGGPRMYRVDVARVPAAPGEEQVTQLVLEDITAEIAEGNRVHRFAELLLHVQEEERRRIAQELHDEPLQLLIHLARSLERLETTPQTPSTMSDGLQGARNQAIGIAFRVRTVLAGLRPPALDQLGLVPALRGLLAEVADASGIAADLHVTGRGVRLPPQLELGTFRIAQEAVNNVIRHAGATKLLVTLSFSEHALTLTVSDDGSGFDPGELDSRLLPGSMGLLGMRERAALAGGVLNIRSAPGQGTTVMATFAHEEAPGDRAVHADGKPDASPGQGHASASRGVV
jgi:signal transduction histidine kinase